MTLRGYSLKEIGRERFDNFGPMKLLMEVAQTHGYYVAYKLITLSCISFMFTEIKFIYYHS